MGFRLRVLRAFVLLAGFFLMGFVLLAAMAVLDWLLVTRVFVDRAEWAAATLVTGTVVVAVAILQGMFAFLRAGRLETERHAVAVGPEDQPELWDLVRAAAGATGERPPDELYLDADVNAGVTEQGRLLGLLPGRRRMYLGLPLLAGLTVPQLRGILAHEFGHYAHLDTRLGGVIVRGRAAVLHTVDVFGRNDTFFHRAVGLLYITYAHLFLRTSQAVGREQERAADRSAARHAGRDATAAALGALPVLIAAHDHYLTAYAGMGEPVGALPQPGEVYGGFRRMVDARSPEGIAELSAGRRPPRPHRYDSHPPTAERVAAVEALPDDGRAAELDDSRPALTLLRHAEEVFTALEACTLPAEAAASPRMDWDDLVMARAVLDAEQWARPLRVAVARAVRAEGAGTGGTPAGPVEDDALPGLEEVLDAFDRGLLWREIAERMPRPHQAARLTGASARDVMRPRVFDGLAGLVHLRLVQAGRATPDVAWSGRPGLALPDAWEQGMDDALDAAVADTPDSAPLRALLAGVGSGSTAGPAVRTG
ncbi:M48 family metallopeptidase [Streptomyces longwoodensis]|uniref:M48 family metallopeptidase n=1 Tax=Streptomyces longwoodensis TaxID=68231 RepID=UPI0022585F49|nr:M48 family metallopeptidase [Streptomyces longwoodensis]MCX4994005.1 M48 family metallopeptidase [Streptomyces longwoodensis]